MVELSSEDFKKTINETEYPYLSKYTHPVKMPTREIIGRDLQMRKIMATFARPELSNIILLAEAGGGKTALIQGLMMKDPGRVYLEVQLSRMISDAKDHPDSIAEWLRSIFEESSKFGKQSKYEIVLFIDEFHQIVQVSPAAVEVLKPLLADSGTRGIRVAAATTYAEYQKYISSNLPLVERFQRVQLPQPTEEVVISILRNMAKRYNVADQMIGDRMYKLIYEYTNRYIPAQIQPRKSILVLDDMIGYHRAWNRPMDMKLLADVLYDEQGVNVAFSADATKIEETLKKHVLHQSIAIAAIAHRLQICIADLNDKTKPMSSMLFTGSTGVGKTEMAKQLTKILFQDSQQLIRFDMTEYANEDSLDRFKNELTTQVWAHPYCILLLDEIEKACSPVTRILLQVLDDGRLSDENNRTVSFINCYIIMTTNAASDLYRTVGQYRDKNETDKQFLTSHENLIRQTIQETTDHNQFPPELLGRIDTIVPFIPLSIETKEEITEMHLNDLCNEIMRKHNIKTLIDPKVVKYLVEDTINNTDSDSGGAREIMHKLETEVITPIAEYINAHPQQHTIYAKVKGQTAYDDKNKRVSDAYVIVVPIAQKQQNAQQKGQNGQRKLVKTVPRRTVMQRQTSTRHARSKRHPQRHQMRKVRV